MKRRLTVTHLMHQTDSDTDLPAKCVCPDRLRFILVSGFSMLAAYYRERLRSANNSMLRLHKKNLLRIREVASKTKRFIFLWVLSIRRHPDAWLKIFSNMCAILMFHTISGRPQCLTSGDMPYNIPKRAVGNDKRKESNSLWYQTYSFATTSAQLTPFIWNLGLMSIRDGADRTYHCL